jgi:hypothetical protein
MYEINDQPRSLLIAAVFCAIIGLIAYAGYLQNGWVGIAITSDLHQAAMGGTKGANASAPSAAR